MLLAGILGAKIPLFIQSPGYYVSSLKHFFDLLRSGGVILAGLIAAVLVALVYFRKHKMNAWQLLDIAAPSIILGQAIGRIGCFLAGCCYGNMCSTSLGVEFNSKIAHLHTGVPLGVHIHPVQLYNSIANFTIFFILLFIYKKRIFTGQVFLSYMILYSVSRFTTEFFRGDVARITIGGPLADAQYIAIFAFFTGIVLMILKYRKTRENKN